MTTQEAASRAFLPNVIRSLGTIYHSSTEALCQPIENEGDAGATQVWVVLEREKITVVGNGNGMLPRMLPDDKVLLDEFFELAGADDPQDITVDALIDPSSPSRKSLEWMLSCIALSSKSPGQRDVRGMRGIGALAYLQYAGQAVYTTKPSESLVQSYWGKDARKYANKTFSLTYGYPEAVARTTTKDIVEGTGQLSDPWGDKLAHGTRVEISLIREGEDDIFKPSALAAFFKNRFGNDVRSGRYKLFIIDRISDEAARHGGERKLEVEGSSYKGVLILDEEAYVRGFPFHIQLWYDPNAKSASPSVRHKGSDKFPLTNLSVFKDDDPWSSGHLSGFVDFPTYPNEDALWDAAKNNLLTSPQRNQWEKRVRELDERVRQQIAQLTEIERSKSLRELAPLISKAAVEAMKNVGAFSDFVVTTPTHEPGRDKPPGPPRPHVPGVTATILNERNQGIEGVQIELSQAGRVLAQKQTGLSGSVAFGRMPAGKYTIRPIPNESWSDFKPVSRQFDLGSPESGEDAYKALFRADSGLPQAPRRKLSGFSMEFTPLDDPDALYAANLQVGLIRYNSGHPELIEAHASSDEERLISFVAHCTAAAVTEHFIKADVRYAVQQQAMLFVEIARQLRSQVQRTRRRPRRS